MRKIIFTTLALVALAGCRPWQNFTTYFNYLWYARDLYDRGTEEERKKEITEPRVFHFLRDERDFDVPQKPAKTSPIYNKQLLDSSLLEISKILQNHTGSSLLPSAMILAAQVYEYQQNYPGMYREMMDLLQRFPESDKAPEAALWLGHGQKGLRHLDSALLAYELSSRLADERGNKEISWKAHRAVAELVTDEDMYRKMTETVRRKHFLRSVDVPTKRRDHDTIAITSQEYPLPRAMREYEIAIANCNDEDAKARMLIELGTLYWKAGLDEKADRAFAEAAELDGTKEGVKLEALLQRSVVAEAKGNTQLASELRRKFLATPGGDSYAGYLAFEETRGKTKRDESAHRNALIQQLKAMDSLGTRKASQEAVRRANYELGRLDLEKKDYEGASMAFAKAAASVTPAARRARDLSLLTRTLVATRKRIEGVKDSVSILLAELYITLGSTFRDLGEIDSARSSYDKAEHVAPPSDSTDVAARAIYAKAVMLSSDIKTPRSAIDILYSTLIERFPETEFAEKARAYLGLDDKSVRQIQAEMYESAEAANARNEYEYAVKKFDELAERYQHSEYAPKSLYAAGWTYVESLNMPDSGVVRFRKLVDRYPTSEYAAKIRSALETFEREAPKKIQIIPVKDSVVTQVAEKSDSTKKQIELRKPKKK